MRRAAVFRDEALAELGRVVSERTDVARGDHYDAYRVSLGDLAVEVRQHAERANGLGREIEIRTRAMDSALASLDARRKEIRQVRAPLVAELADQRLERDRLDRESNECDHRRELAATRRRRAERSLTEIEGNAEPEFETARGALRTEIDAMAAESTTHTRRIDECRAKIAGLDGPIAALMSRVEELEADDEALAAARKARKTEGQADVARLRDAERDARSAERTAQSRMHATYVDIGRDATRGGALSGLEAPWTNARDKLDNIDRVRAEREELLDAQAALDFGPAWRTAGVATVVFAIAFVAMVLW